MWACSTQGTAFTNPQGGRQGGGGGLGNPQDPPTHIKKNSSGGFEVHKLFLRPAVVCLIPCDSHQRKLLCACPRAEITYSDTPSHVRGRTVTSQWLNSKTTNHATCPATAVATATTNEKPSSQRCAVVRMEAAPPTPLPQVMVPE